MKFLIDAMFSPGVSEILRANGHDAISPAGLGDRELPDDELVLIATAERRVIVTENARDFADVTTCPVLIALKGWWPSEALAHRLAAALDRWAAENPDPGPWPRWLDAEFRDASREAR